MMDAKETVFISEGEIAKYMYNRLIESGYVPETDKVLELAEIMFDYLIDKGVLEVTIDEADDGFLDEWYGEDM
jgi:hypothetical protein